MSNGSSSGVCDSEMTRSASAISCWNLMNRSSSSSRAKLRALNVKLRQCFWLIGEQAMNSTNVFPPGSCCCSQTVNGSGTR